ncbi:WRKY Transcription Factor [Ancistrocladus abbreviatus]
MEEVADWDLQAVVRAFTTASTATATTSSSAAATKALDLHPPKTCFSSFGLEDSDGLFGFQDPFGSININTTNSSMTSCEELESLYKPFCSDLQTSPSPPPNNTAITSASSAAAALLPRPQRQQLLLPHQQRQQQVGQSQVIFGPTASVTSATSIVTPQSQRISPTSTSNTTSQSQRTKKRKNVLKKVCHVPAEGLSSDMWAWRKYGQKPIKGSPYPRGYYRCSSSKGCMARKQVERNRSDPKMFIVTYTAEHNHPMPTHRNSLAGSTRQKPTTAQQTPATAGDTTTINSPNSTSTSTSTSAATTTTPRVQHSCYSPTTSFSPMTEKSESKTEYEDLMKDDDDNDMGLPDMTFSDDFFMGFEDLDSTDPGDWVSNEFPTCLEFPWLANSSSTATAAGGS